MLVLLGFASNFSIISMRPLTMFGVNWTVVRQSQNYLELWLIKCCVLSNSRIMFDHAFMIIPKNSTATNGDSLRLIRPCLFEGVKDGLRR